MGYSFGDISNYVIFTNPLSHGMISAMSSLARSTGVTSGHTKSVKAATQLVFPELHRMAGSHLYFSRLGGISGALAVCMSVYESKRSIEDYDNPKVDMQKIYDTTNRFHFIHSLALIAVPLVRRPVITGILMTTGTALYCGSGYFYAFTGKSKHVQAIAAAGTCFLILAWISVVL